MTPIKAIRAYCISCCRENRNEVRLCQAAACPLFPYRMGHRPKPGAEDPGEDITGADDLETIPDAQDDN